MLGKLVDFLEPLEPPVETAPMAPMAPIAAAPEVPSPAYFQGLEFLAGGVWVNADPTGTTCETIEFCLSARYLSSMQVRLVGNPPSSVIQTHGMMGVTPAKKIIMWAFVSTGQFVSLEQVAPSPPGGWTLEGVVQGAMIRQSLYKIDTNAMQTVSSRQVKGLWQDSPPVVYKRM